MCVWISQYCSSLAGYCTACHFSVRCTDIHVRCYNQSPTVWIHCSWPSTILLCSQHMKEAMFVVYISYCLCCYDQTLDKNHLKEGFVLVHRWSWQSTMVMKAWHIESVLWPVTSLVFVKQRLGLEPWLRKKFLDLPLPSHILLPSPMSKKLHNLPNSITN